MGRLLRYPLAVVIGLLLSGGAVLASPAHTLLLEAEGFDELGGWVVDTQVMDQMGSPFLMAHGLGRPVQDAVTRVTFPAAGTYRVLVRTRDWAAPWNAPASPGRFQVLVGGEPLLVEFGTEGAEWHWQDGGTVEVVEGALETTLALRDLTGFNGRCDAILFTTDMDLAPPNGLDALTDFRRGLRGIEVEDAGEFDLVVVGGGIAGTCAAVSAARRGVKVALVQNRPVLGGNNSSEVRVGLSGRIHQEPYPELGNLVDEIGPVGHHLIREALQDPETPRSRRILEVVEADPRKKIHNAGPAANYEDDQARRVVQGEENISLFLNTHVFAVEMDGPEIRAVIARSTTDGREMRMRGRWFADCTGDGNLGYLAGADYRYARESRAETGEDLAPEEPDRLIMGTSVQWYSVEEDQPSTFPDCPWAVSFNEETFQNAARGDWDWETGFGRCQIGEIEQIRDYALRVIFGNWAYLKNDSPGADKFANRRLEWVAYIGGKRASRRLLGDVILQEQDLVEQRPFPDASVTTTWPIDVHFPHPENTKHFPGEEFRSRAEYLRIKPYPIPYRCFYSRNVDNLFMAGRNISVTYVALGSVRVMRTGGMMGEVVGMAAALCKRHGCNPRDVYSRHLGELQELMAQGVPDAGLLGADDRPVGRQ